MTDKQEPTPEQILAFQKAMGEAGQQFREAMAWAKASFAIGNSFANHRKGEPAEAQRLILDLPAVQRDAVVRWCAWLVGMAGKGDL